MNEYWLDSAEWWLEVIEKSQANYREYVALDWLDYAAGELRQISVAMNGLRNALRAI